MKVKDLFDVFSTSTLIGFLYSNIPDEYLEFRTGLGFKETEIPYAISIPLDEVKGFKSGVLLSNGDYVEVVTPYFSFRFERDKVKANCNCAYVKVNDKELYTCEVRSVSVFIRNGKLKITFDYFIDKERCYSDFKKLFEEMEYDLNTPEALKDYIENVVCGNYKVKVEGNKVVLGFCYDEFNAYALDVSNEGRSVSVVGQEGVLFGITDYGLYYEISGCQGEHKLELDTIKGFKVLYNGKCIYLVIEVKGNG